MTSTDSLLLAARFDGKLRTYWFMQLAVVFLATVVGIVLLPFWLLGWGQWYARRSFDALICELHERSLVVKRGIFFRVEKTIPLDKIQDLTVKEGPLLRWLGLRSLRIETAGQGTPGASEADLVGIVDPIDFRDAVLKQRDVLSGATTSTALPTPPGGEAEGSIELLTEIRDLLRRMVERQ